MDIIFLLTFPSPLPLLPAEAKLLTLKKRLLPLPVHLNAEIFRDFRFLPVDSSVLILPIDRPQSPPSLFHLPSSAPSPTVAGKYITRLQSI